MQIEVVLIQINCVRIFLNTVNVPRQTSIQYTHGFGETGMKSLKMGNQILKHQR